MTAPKRVQLGREPRAAAIGRRWIEHEAGDDLEASTLNNLKLVATELINNAYLHGRGNIELVMELLKDRVRVEVVDKGQDAAIAIRTAGPGGGGWGLKIVDQLTSAWGAHEGTTHVWAELPLS